MKFYTGKDYPHLCNGCKAIIDQCVDMVQMGADTDDNEAPSLLAYDRGLFCGGHECECDCSIGFPEYDDENDILCRVHGGTKEEQQAFNERLCEELGHWFPSWTARLNREWVCLICEKVYGRSDSNITRDTFHIVESQDASNAVAKAEEEVTG